jgi:regulator of protease activity HflC (stomatin/prohibitin superfamily)
MVGIILLAVLAFVVLVVAARSIRIIPQSRVAIVQRLGRYHRTAESGLTFVVPIVDRMLPKTDLREQVVAFQPQAVITSDNVGMQISTVVYYQVVDARAAEYEVANFTVALEQITQTTLRNVIGNLTLDKTLTSRDEINAKLRTVLDEVTERWGIRVTRVEIKEIIPPRDIQQAMEKQMQAERTRRAAILTAEGDKRSAILKAEGEKESAVLRAQGEKQSAVLRAEGEAEAYRSVQAAQIEMAGALFERLGTSDLSPEALRYLYLRTLPEVARGSANKLFVVPSELGDLAGAVSALAGGASLANEPTPDGAADGSSDGSLARSALGAPPNGSGLPARNADGMA